MLTTRSAVPRALSTLAAFAAARWRPLLAILITIGLLGELYFRLPFVPQPLEYQPDREIGGILRPNQRGYVWLANMSLQSPLITLNKDGHRGRDTDWTAPFVLVVGDSEWFGAGVTDGEAWPALLQQTLRRRPGEGAIQVVNASHPGFGPQHEAVVLRRILANHRPRLVLVRVDIGQRGFRIPAPADRENAFAAAQYRQLVRRVTKFLPYLVDKVQAQRESIVRAFTPFGGGPGSRAAADESGNRARSMLREMTPAWREMAEMAASRGIPLVFVLHDLTDSADSRILYDGLEALGRPYGARVWRIDAAALGLGDVPAKDRPAAVRETLTLGRDPHANPRQHRLIAELIARDIDRDKLLDAAAAR